MSTQSRLRWLLLLLILCAFLRVTWQLGAKDLWWDESLSLQRAESSIGALLRADLPMTDGTSTQPTTDQHPFLFFLLAKVLISLAGNSEYALRFVSAMATTLMVPALWICGRLFARRAIVADSTPMWAALLAAASPFFLWYGQEARPYALWTLLALLSSYTLLRATEETSDGIVEETIVRRRQWWYGFLIAEFLFLTTHYFALFLLPVHALLIFLWFRRHNVRLALFTSAGLLIPAAAVGIAIGRAILARGGGINFDRVPPGIIARDLLNAFGMGPSADVGMPLFLGLDLLFGLLALIGIAWALRSKETIAGGGWSVPAMVLTPVLLLLLVQIVHPLYMNSRHMSLISGAYLLAAAAGLGTIWQRQQWVAGLITLLLLLGNGQSSFRYFFLERYAKDDFSSLGRYIDEHLLPGDIILYDPPFSWYHFQYYLPTAQIKQAQRAGLSMGYHGVPLVGDNGNFDATRQFIAQSADKYRRIWLVKSSTHAFLDPDHQVETLLEELTDYRLSEKDFFSHSLLRAALYYPKVPVYNEPLAQIPNPLAITFADQIHLIGIEVGQPITPQNHTPITLYWQIANKTDQRYKYILRAEELADGQWVEVMQSEREPFEGWIPTDLWYPGQTFVEDSDLPPVLSSTGAGPLHQGLKDGRYRLTLELYNADTLQKLPITQAEGGAKVEGGTRLILPSLIPNPTNQ